jgi:hypothetical protein
MTYPVFMLWLNRFAVAFTFALLVWRVGQEAWGMVFWDAVIIAVGTVNEVMWRGICEEDERG